MASSFVRQHQRVFHSEEHSTSYYGGEIYQSNGLYVPPASMEYHPETLRRSSVDNYAYLPPPPPRPPLPSNFPSVTPSPAVNVVYPENAGHLV
jgi:hypothetical protein